jgi:hypothetical protein
MPPTCTDRNNKTGRLDSERKIWCGVCEHWAAQDDRNSKGIAYPRNELVCHEKAKTDRQTETTPFF